LFVACHELAQMPENPYPVIINEAVEICKAYGGTEGYKFINGILDKLAQELRPNDPVRLNKAQA
ncbi:MAG: N utilization substance protein B, partial [Neisseriaceae bacterium]|nr:N utilization substance protein B [Neisseriaceae bacterium]